MIAAIPKNLAKVIIREVFSTKISGYFLPKAREKIIKKIYFIPCKELTMAGEAKEIANINKSSEAAAEIWPAAKSQTAGFCILRLFF